MKPENILLTEGLTHVVADWGLGDFMHQESKVLTALTRGGMGSEYYCSLEQWASGKCDCSGDVYSLGMVAAELATGAQVSIPLQGAGITTPIVNEVEAGAARFNHVLRAMAVMLSENRLATMSLSFASAVVARHRFGCRAPHRVLQRGSLALAHVAQRS